MFSFRWIFKVLQIAGIVTSWAATALQDNKITIVEAAHLAEQIADVLGIEAEIEIPS